MSLDSWEEETFFLDSNDIRATGVDDEDNDKDDDVDIAQVEVYPKANNCFVVLSYCLLCTNEQ